LQCTKVRLVHIVNSRSLKEEKSGKMTKSQKEVGRGISGRQTVGRYSAQQKLEISMTELCDRKDKCTR
jgi:hypothetical protein